MIAASSGGLGDIVFAIPVMRTLGITTIYVKRSYYFEPYGDLFRASCRLLEQHGFTVHPTSGDYPPHQYDPALQFDYDLDASRKQPMRGKNHIMLSYLNQYKLAANGWKQPWLNITWVNELQPGYSLIHLTPRWRTNSKVNWKQVLQNIPEPRYFIGFSYEHVEFCRLYGNVSWLPCQDILDMAILIRDCKALYCNQSVSLAIAQGLGKDYFLEVKPTKTNCLMYTNNEHIL